MGDLSDLLPVLIPIVIFIISAIAGSANKKNKAASTHDNGPDLINIFKSMNIDADTTAKPQQAVRKQEPKSTAKNPAGTFSEGEKAINTPHSNPPAHNSDDDLPTFDAKTAIIYSTIIERKY